jgi:hypothetical protein
VFHNDINGRADGVEKPAELHDIVLDNHYK